MMATRKLSSFLQKHGLLLALVMVIFGLGLIIVGCIPDAGGWDATHSILTLTSMPPISTADWIDQAILYPLPDTSPVLPPKETVPLMTATMPPPIATDSLVPSKTSPPTWTLTCTITPTAETVVCHDDLAEVQAALSDQWSLLDPHSDPRRTYYDSKPWRFTIPLVSSGNFYEQTMQLADGSEVWLDIVTAYSVDDDNNLYALDVAVGAQYVGEPYTLFINRWSPFEAQITNLDEAKEMLARGRLFSISMSDFVAQTDTIIWNNCPNVDWYAEYFGKDACELGQIVEESQVTDFVTTLVRGGSPPDGHNMLLAGWVIHIPNEMTGAVEFGYLNMPDCE